MDTENKLAYGILGLVLIPCSAFFNGWAMSVLWEWFVVPVTTLHPISIAEALGLGVLVSLATQIHKTDSRDLKTKVSDQFVNSIILPIFAVGVGWVITLCL